jgi:hypothetical protein
MAVPNENTQCLFKIITDVKQIVLDRLDCKTEANINEFLEKIRI